MAVGAKRIETRSWPATSNGHGYRGWVAICASKKTKESPKEGGRPLYEIFMDVLVRAPESVPRFAEHGYTSIGKHPVGGDYFHCYSERLPLGSVVAVGWLQDCAQTDGLKISIEERAWGNYSPGRYAWVFSEVWRINQPFPVRGMQKLFDLQMPDQWQNHATRVF